MMGKDDSIGKELVTDDDVSIEMMLSLLYSSEDMSM